VFEKLLEPLVFSKQLSKSSARGRIYVLLEIISNAIIVKERRQNVQSHIHIASSTIDFKTALLGMPKTQLALTLHPHVFGC